MFSAYQFIFMPSVHGAQGNSIVPPHVTCGMVGLRPFYNSEAVSASMIVRKRSYSEIELKLKSTSVHKKARHFERKRKDSILERIKQRAIERKKLWRQWNRERLSRIGTTPPLPLPAPSLPPLDPFYILNPSPLPDFCFIRHYHTSTSSDNTTMPMEDVQYQRDVAPLAIIFKPNTTARPSRPPLRSRRNSRNSRPHLPSPPISPTIISSSKSGSVGSTDTDEPQRKRVRRVRCVIRDEEQQ
ncbi:hypothetical protein BDF22DRAFT_733240 [Syncephalis plumigaleata]|nr:hypothetical protein BDF22DRAFT_733240 [Syncephalis plumigaleata]